MIPRTHWTRFVGACAAVLALSTVVGAQGSGLGGMVAPQDGFTAGPGGRTAVTSIQELVRFEGHGQTRLRGVGIVVGLRGTGDAGSELALARPLAEYYKNNLNAVADLKDLAKAKSAALVMLECVIPDSGALRDDAFDVHVMASHSASSLAGGRLLLSAMFGPLRDQGVYAIASGPVVLEDATSTTAGVVRGGAVITEDIRMQPLGESFNLIVRPEARGWTTTELIASAINASTTSLDEEDSGAPRIATALDETTIRIDVPRSELGDPAGFMSRLLTTSFAPSLLNLPQQVVVNERTGTIVASAGVEISPVAISHASLTISTASPGDPAAGAGGGAAGTTTWSSVGTDLRPSTRARLSDLLAAFKQLDVPVRDQISILDQIHSTGRLHAEFIVR